jgi:competence protein ComGF
MGEDRGVRELALQCAVAEAVELVKELRELKVNFSLELQSVRDQRVAEHREWAEFIAEMRQELDRIKADFRTEATLLHLIEPRKKEQAGEEQWDESKDHPSSQSNTLKQFVASSR